MKGSLLQRIQLCSMAEKGTTCFVSLLSRSRSDSQVVKNSNLHALRVEVRTSVRVHRISSPDRPSFVCKANSSRRRPNTNIEVGCSSDLRDLVWSLKSSPVLFCFLSTLHCLDVDEGITLVETVFKLPIANVYSCWKANRQQSKRKPILQEIWNSRNTELFPWPLKLDRFTITTHQSCPKKSTPIA